MFCASIDFRKAYDSVNREILWTKRDNLGLNGRLLYAVKSLYNNVLCSVKRNGFTTDWFSVNCGLKPGCSLSPLLFNLYINDLAFKIDALGKRVKVSILLYADDVVLIAESEPDLQSMLDIMGTWCKNNLLSSSKSNILQFRNPSEPQSSVTLSISDDAISYTSLYKYLGLVLTEHLDYSIKAKIVAQSANRAFGPLIAKSKAFGGLQYGPFTKRYELVIRGLFKHYVD